MPTAFSRFTFRYWAVRGYLVYTYVMLGILSSMIILFCCQMTIFFFS